MAAEMEMQMGRESGKERGRGGRGQPWRRLMSDKLLAARDDLQWSIALRQGQTGCRRSGGSTESNRVTCCLSLISHLASLDSLTPRHLRNRTMPVSLARPAYQRFSQYDTSTQPHLSTQQPRRRSSNSTWPESSSTSISPPSFSALQLRSHPADYNISSHLECTNNWHCYSLPGWLVWLGPND